ncbi:ArsO family NAD(P)H-dependent flavin-containing monooxygenase [Advenella sp. EE-W14]|uniref:ArsO family NAD(P)H-dependent flavin-containing monooxygenase n=1 Tax=Advenella sp. EE-W14 TaxID=2722705 RepID=UPI0020071555|nr:ArsO family NAD(P)H-dependent flavin-containing monooxygenase [Advenella sp. EE-W14]
MIKADNNPMHVDVVIIGGGQAGLATAYFLRRTGLSFVVLDNQVQPGGAWLHGWQSLRLFSPANWSSLPGWPMPASTSGVYPSRDEVLDYFTRYEARYAMPVMRPVQVQKISKDGQFLLTHTEKAIWQSRAVVSATGNWSNPYIPVYPGSDVFKGKQQHSASYIDPEGYKNQRVAVVGGGNSGAQILAELSKVAQTLWITPSPPVFLPDDVDGRVLFERATERWLAQKEGRTVDIPIGGLGDIVMVPPVREARERGVLVADRPFSRFTETGIAWDDGRHQEIDAVVWCTGFRPALQHLAELGVVEPDGKVLVKEGHCIKEPRLWLVGYGDWTGPASATLAGVMRAARSCVAEIEHNLTEGSFHG